MHSFKTTHTITNHICSAGVGWGEPSSAAAQISSQRAGGAQAQLPHSVLPHQKRELLAFCSSSLAEMARKNYCLSPIKTG